ncbi:unnamed protein product, partial [Trichogramma brassicae]
KFFFQCGMESLQDKDNPFNRRPKSRIVPQLFIVSIVIFMAQHSNEAVALPQRLNKNIVIDFECKDVKLELPSVLATICEFEYQTCQPIGKIENDNQRDNTYESMDKDVECNDVKLELPSISTTICKSDYQTCRPIVKIDNENQTDNINESISIDFECKDVKLELPSTSKNICKSKYQTCLPIVEIENKNLTDDNNENISIDFECQDVKLGVQSQSTTNCKFDIKNIHPIAKIEDESLTEDIDEDISIEVECQNVKLGEQSQSTTNCKSDIGIIPPSLNLHIQTVHKHKKPFKCEICYQSFGYKARLNEHINSVHNQIKPFKCDTCHKLFSRKGNLSTHSDCKIHVDAVHEARQYVQDSMFEKKARRDSKRARLAATNVGCASNTGVDVTCACIWASCDFGALAIRAVSVRETAGELCKARRVSDPAQLLMRRSRRNESRSVGFAMPAARGRASRSGITVTDVGAVVSPTYKRQRMENKAAEGGQQEAANLTLSSGEKDKSITGVESLPSPGLDSAEFMPAAENSDAPEVVATVEDDKVVEQVSAAAPLPLPVNQSTPGDEHSSEPTNESVDESVDEPTDEQPREQQQLNEPNQGPIKVNGNQEIPPGCRRCFICGKWGTYTSEQIKAYKSLEAYKYFKAGFVDNVNHVEINKHFVVLAKVMPIKTFIVLWCLYCDQLSALASRSSDPSMKISKQSTITSLSRMGKGRTEIYLARSRNLFSDYLKHNCYTMVSRIYAFPHPRFRQSFRNSISKPESRRARHIICIIYKTRLTRASLVLTSRKSKKNAKMRKRTHRQRDQHQARPQIQAPTFRPLHRNPNVQHMRANRGSEAAQAAAACVAALALVQNQPVGDWGPTHVDAAIDAGRQAHRETVQLLRAAKRPVDDRAIGPLELEPNFFVGIHRYEVCTRLARRGRCGAQSSTPDEPSLAEALQRLYDASADSPCAVLELDGQPPRRFAAAWHDRGRTDYYYALDPAPGSGQQAVLFQCSGLEALIDTLRARLDFGDETRYVLYHVKLMGQMGFVPPPVPPPAVQMYDEARALSPPRSQPKKKETAKKSRLEQRPAPGPAVRVQPVPPQQQQQQLRQWVNEPPQQWPFVGPPVAVRYDEARALSPPRSQSGVSLQELWAAARAQEAVAPPYQPPVGVQQRLPDNPRLKCAYANLPTLFKTAFTKRGRGQSATYTPTSTKILQFKHGPKLRVGMSARSLVALAVMRVRPPLTWQDKDIVYAINLGFNLFNKMLDNDRQFRGANAWAYRDVRLEIDNEKLIVDVDRMTAGGPIRSYEPRVPGVDEAVRWFFDETRVGGGPMSCELHVGADAALGIYRDEQKCFWLYDERPHTWYGGLMIITDINEDRGLATLFRLLTIDDLVERLMSSMDKEMPPLYQLRRVDFLPDLPGTIDWHRFRPYRSAASWILRGSPGLHAASPERFDAANHDRQSLGTATAALVASRSVQPSEWDATTVDLAVIEGDAYYTWCKPKDNEGPNEPERILRPSNMRLVMFHGLRKCRFRVREQAVTGRLCLGDQLLQSLRFFFYELGEDRCIFEALNGTQPIRYLGLWASREELDNGIMDWTWYLFHDHATSQLARAALGDQYRDETSAIAPEQESGCVLRFSRLEDARDVLVALFCGSQGDDDDDDRILGGSLPQQQEQAPGQEVAYCMHALLVDSIEGQPMDIDELVREMSRSVIPEATEYARDTPTSGHLLGSQYGTVARYVHRQLGWTRAGTALAALAMRHLCDPFKWTTLTVDTILDLGDAISAKWRSEIREDDDAAAAAAADNDPDAGSGEQLPPPPQPRDYLLPHEIGSIQLGINEIGLTTQQILDDEERQATIRQQLCRHLEELFELTYQAVLRSGRTQLAVWRFDGVYFCLEPSGNEANKYLAGVYYWLELEGLCAFLTPILLDAGGGEIQTYGVSVDSIGNVPESARPNVTNEAVKQDWYNWIFVGKDHWTIGYDEQTTYEEINTASINFLARAQIYEPHQWSVGLLRQAVIVARGLHMLNVGRLGEDRKFTPYEMISEFFIGNRQIRLVMEDCVAYGRPNDDSFESGLDFAMDNFHGVILNATGPGDEYFWAIWLCDKAYYVLTPSKGLVRKKYLNWSFFSDSLGIQWQMTGVNVTNCEFVRHLVDPSPAIAPSTLPPMNAYRPIMMRNGPECTRASPISIIQLILADKTGPYSVRRANLFVWRVRAENQFHRQLLRPVAYVMAPDFSQIDVRIAVIINEQDYSKTIKVSVLQASLQLRSRVMPRNIAGRQSAVAFVALALARIQSPMTWSRRTLDYIINNGTALHAERQAQLGAPVGRLLDILSLPGSLHLGGRVRVRARRREYPEFGVWRGLDVHLAEHLERHFGGPRASDFSILELRGKTGASFPVAIIRSEGRYYFFDPSQSNGAVTKRDGRAALFKCSSTQQLAEIIFTVYNTVLAKSECDVGELKTYMIHAFDMSASFNEGY